MRRASTFNTQRIDPRYQDPHLSVEAILPSSGSRLVSWRCKASQATDRLGAQDNFPGIGASYGTGRYGDAEARVTHEDGNDAVGP